MLPATDSLRAAFMAAFGMSPAACVLWEPLRDATGAVIDLQVVAANDAGLGWPGSEGGGLPGARALERLGPEALAPFLGAARDALVAGRGSVVDVGFPGVQQWSKVTLSPLGDLVTTVAVDVTAEHQAMAAGARHAADLVDALRIARVAGIRFDLGTGMVIYTDEALELMRFGPERRQISIADFEHHMPASSTALARTRIAEAVRTGECPPFEVENRRGDGSSGWFEISGRPVHDDAGAVVAFDATVLDITDRRRAEIALEQVEERFRTTLEAMVEGITVVGHDGTVLLQNSAARRQMAATVMAGSDVPTAGAADNRHAVYWRVLETRRAETFETAVPTVDGPPRWMAIGVHPHPDGIVAVTSDRTSEHEARLALAASEAMFRAVFEENPESLGIARPVVDDHGAFVDVEVLYENRVGRARAFGGAPWARWLDAACSRPGPHSGRSWGTSTSEPPTPRRPSASQSTRWMPPGASTGRRPWSSPLKVASSTWAAM